MLDHLIRRATVVDGTGGPAYTADVGIRGGRIVVVAEPGAVTEEAVTSEDADGLVLAPGFVDPHTHYDAQLFWDPYATPSMNHGVTTVAGGNCGFTLAPLHPDRPEDADYTRRMMSRVEGMALAALEEGVDWTWSTFREYLDALEGRIAVNAGFMVGHCALRRRRHGRRSRRRAAHPRATGRHARPVPRRDGRRGLGALHHPVLHPLRRRRRARRLPARPARGTARPLPRGRRARGDPVGGDRRRVPGPVLRRGDRPLRRHDGRRRTPAQLERPHHRRRRPRTRTAPVDPE